jgi:amino acid permease
MLLSPHRYDAAFHNVTAMVGAGVLGLPSTFATLGWAGGLIVLVGSLGISWYTFGLLTHLHEGETENGSIKRYNRYHEVSLSLTTASTSV